MRVFATVFSGCLSRQMLFQDSPEGLGNPRRGSQLGPERHRKAQTAQESLRAAQRDSKRSEDTQRGPEKPGEAHRTGPESHREARLVCPERSTEPQRGSETPTEVRRGPDSPSDAQRDRTHARTHRERPRETKNDLNPEYPRRPSEVLGEHSNPKPAISGGRGERESQAQAMFP